jgi:hypothetical protein
VSANPDSRRRASSTFSTGGGGTRYEHLVGGWLAAGLLAGVMPLGRDFGNLSEIRLQGEASGWVLDDLVVSGEGATKSRWSASVKSHNMLSGAKLEEQFVESAWAELLGGNFEAGRDRIGLVCGHAAEAAWRSLLRLIAACSADPKGIAGRIKVTGAFNEDSRSLWDSAGCPSALAKESGVHRDTSPGRLLAALLPLRLDLLEPTSQTLPEAIGWCRQALIPEQAGDADDLWKALCDLVTEVAPGGGVLDAAMIGARLGTRFAIRNRPDLEPDWELLARHTHESLATVRDQIGTDLRLPRREAWTALAAADDETKVVLLTGPSGCGKSALARRWLEDGPRTALWLSALHLSDGLAGFARKLSLQRSLPELLGKSAEPTRIVIDGLDRSHDPEPFASAARLAQLAAESEGRIALLITAQEMEMPRVSERLRVANAPASRLAVISDLDDEDVRLAQAAEPRLAEITVAGQLHALFRRPKLVDLFLSASRSGMEAPSDEAGLARLWWQTIVSSGPESASRQALVLRLASKQADDMVAATMSDELSPADVASVDDLRRDGVLAPDGARYEFAHDLFADWALLHRLEALEDRAVTELGAKVELPTWHRTIRLFALSVLREQGLEAWGAHREELERQDQWLLAELFLDAALFAHDSAAVVRSLWPTLIADKGDLLRRLLRRLRFSASIPDPMGGLIFAGAPEMETYWAIQRRVPLWPIWIPLLEVLHEERKVALELADAEVAPVVEIWLRFAGPYGKGSDLAAEIALECGRFVREQGEAGTYFGDKLEKSLWSAALSAGSVDPAAVIEMFISALSSDEEGEK